MIGQGRRRKSTKLKDLLKKERREERRWGFWSGRGRGSENREINRKGKEGKREN